MAKPEWGIKRICLNCGAKFYDMQKQPIVCPKCATEFNPEMVLRSRRQRVAEDDLEDTKVVAVRALGVDDVADDDVEVVDDALLADDDLAADLEDDGDEAFIEDPSDLGADNDDVGPGIDSSDR